MKARRNFETSPCRFLVAVIVGDCKNCWQQPREKCFNMKYVSSTTYNAHENRTYKLMIPNFQTTVGEDKDVIPNCLQTMVFSTR